jgi:PAS domain S-box-containing protein
MSYNVSSPRALRDALGADATLTTLRRQISALPHPVLVADRAGHYVAANAAAGRLTGYTIGELLEKALPDLTGGSDETVSDSLWRAFLHTGEQTGTFEIRKKDGSTILVRYTALANVLPGLHVSFLTPV